MTGGRQEGTRSVLVLATGVGAATAGATVPVLLARVAGQGIVPGPVTVLAPSEVAEDLRPFMPADVVVRPTGRPAADHDGPRRGVDGDEGLAVDVQNDSAPVIVSSVSG